jgi:hypothetical protein
MKAFRVLAIAALTRREGRRSLRTTAEAGVSLPRNGRGVGDLAPEALFGVAEKKRQNVCRNPNELRGEAGRAYPGD